MKFTVVKNSDVIESLSDSDAALFARLVARIMRKRLFAGKLPENKYLVINVDEPYAAKVIELMKAHGHWEE